MLKAHAAFFSFLRTILDLVAVAASWLVVYWVRYYTTLLPVHKGIPTFEKHLQYLAPVVCLCYLSSLFAGLYKVKRMANTNIAIIEIFKASIVSTLGIIAFFYYVQSSTPYSRLLIICFGFIQCTFTMIVHLSLKTILKSIRSMGYNLRYYVIIGAGAKGKKLLEDLRAMAWTGMKCACFIDNNPNLIGTSINGVPVKGPVNKLPKILANKSIDEVYLAMSGDNAQKAYPVLENLQLAGVRIRIVPDWGNLISLSKPDVIRVGSQILFSASDSPLSGSNIVLKRLFDILTSALLIILLSAPMLLIAIIIKLTSKGPVFYKQKRVGLDNKTFNILKFRSMKTDCTKKSNWTVANDPRRTKIGCLLRATSIDELPQLFNVLKGDMSLVGPRPEQEYFVKEFSEEFRRYMLRHKVKTGITGWAQINGLRGNTSLRKRLAYDLHYVKNWSFIFDLWILMRTPLEILKGENAY